MYSFDLCFVSSLLQSYERRGREVHAHSQKEVLHWNEITPEMMSDEEMAGDKYIRHPPDYRSDLFSQFIEVLETRSNNRSQEKNRPRIKRVLGSPVKKAVPHNAKNWMVRPEYRKKDAKVHDNKTENDEETEDDAEDSIDDHELESNESDTESELMKQYQ